MEEACAVCLDGFTPLDPALLLPKCQGHYVHRLCILKTFRSLGPKCPSCSAVYAQLVGEYFLRKIRSEIYFPRRGFESVVRWENFNHLLCYS
ncbi:unnamed protein product [Laminaria digitata]